MGDIRNLDLLSVGIAVASIGVLGFIVFFNNKRSITNKTFLYFSIAAIFWAVFNYSYYKFSFPESPGITLALLRTHAFFAVWYVFFMFQTLYVFPKEKIRFPSWYKRGLLPLTIIVSALTLTKLVFSKITEFSTDGIISKVENGPAVFLFGAVVAGLLISGPILLIKRRLQQTNNTEKKQFTFVLIGALITFSLHMIFNFVFPAFRDNPSYISLGGVFIFPIIAFTTYAILKHHLLNTKIITTEIITFILAIVTLFEVILSDNPLTLIFRSGVFVLVLAFGILLIRSVLKEVEQREELAKINIELRKAKVELEKLSRFKTQMLSFASHQIKAPLATIKGFASILIEGLYGEINDKVKITIGKMKNSADELIDLINSLLDMRKVEEGKMDYKFEPIMIKKLVAETVEQLQVQARGKHLELTFETEVDPEVTADPQKLKQVIQNLTENAIKYTPEGFVRVKLEIQNGSVIFSVIDTGLGMNKELIPRLFGNEFVRDKNVRTQIKGTGLGLYIANQIIKDHGGAIWAESPGESKGSRFYFKLPKAK